MALRNRLIAQIRAGGPMTVAQYMAACLHDPTDGYYATRPALGDRGDFITAPLVSQMFGELIGLWMVQTWIDLGRPDPFRLVEMGPGDGTLMADMVRAQRVAPEFAKAADLWLVETSAPLRRRQAEALGREAFWTNSLAEIPPGVPLLLVANELLDCLPAQQFFRTPNGWAERMVGLSDDGELRFGLSPGIAARPPIDGPEGAIWELSPAQSALGGELGARVAADGGAALLIDYGRDAPGFGDTLQALRAHSKESPLASPGEADLTVHVDFPAVLSAARRAGAQTAPILNQSDFLRRLGLEARAQALTAAHPDRAAVIERQVHRLVARDQMGSLFKVACVHSIGIAPAGFEPSQ